MDIKILVITHKEYWMPKDEVYFPLQVGRAINPDFGFTGDNTGINISEKNPNYCELTGLYWAWKNLSCEYIGVCHYRRYFAHKPKNNSLEAKQQAIFAKSDYEKILQNCDIILPKKRNYYIETIRSHYKHAHHIKDLNEAEKIIKEKYPEYSEPFKRVMEGSSAYILNMAVMRKELFNQYCQWLFDIEFELEKRIDISQYDDRNARVFGFLGERLFNVWLEKQKLKIEEVGVVNLEPINWCKKIFDFLIRKFGL